MRWLRWLVVLVMFAAVVVGFATAPSSDRSFAWTGTSNGGQRCVAEADMRGGGEENRFQVFCGDHRLLDVRGGCEVREQAVDGQGFRAHLRCPGDPHGNRVSVDSQPGWTTEVRTGDHVTPIFWDEPKVYGERFEASPIWVAPVHADDPQWLRWGAVAGLLAVTGLFAELGRRKRRRERRPEGERDADLGQLSVDIEAWPPRGDIVVRHLAPPHGTLRRIPWPAGTPLRLDPDASLDSDELAAGFFWLAGRRAGGSGQGPRDMAPRLDPIAGRGYVLRRQPHDAQAFAPLDAKKNRFIPWAQRGAWLAALLFPLGWGAPFVIVLFMMVLLATLGLTALAWIKRPV